MVVIAIAVVIRIVLVVEGVVVGAIFRCLRGGVGVYGGVVTLEEGVVEDGTKRVPMITARLYGFGNGFGTGLGGQGRGDGGLRKDAVGDVALAGGSRVRLGRGFGLDGPRRI